MINPMKELGTQLSNPKNAKELADQAGINRPIAKVKLYSYDTRYLPHTKEVKQYQGVKYGNNLVGIVGPEYPVMSIVDTLDTTMGQMIATGQIRPTSSGILRHGQKVWVSSEMDLPEADITGGGDKVRPFITNMFDNTGKGANFTFLSLIRIVCENTLRLALGNRNELVQSVRIAHKGKDPLDRVRVDAELFQNASAAYLQWTRCAKRLASISYSQAQASEYLETLFPVNKKSKVKSHTHSKILNLAKYGRGQREYGNQAKGTWWGLLNGVTEYLDHTKGYRGTGSSFAEKELNRKTNRFESVLFGDSSKKKEKAWDLALVMATVAD